jgi:hypothetical protein
MGKTKTEKGRAIGDAFRQEAGRRFVASGRTIKAVAEDLGVGVSSLGDGATLDGRPLECSGGCKPRYAISWRGPSNRLKLPTSATAVAATRIDTPRRA